jgi:hypothetical protein
VKFRISSRIKTERKLKWIRDSAKVFQKISKETGAPVWQFVKNNLDQNQYDHSHQCYVQPNDDSLKRCFIDGGSKSKLPGVGPAICDEFFNSIGIDEFKPDGHTINFLSRINLAGAVRTRKPNRIRDIGIQMARSLSEPRKYVDSHIWHYCAETEGEICTENDPQCNVCRLEIDEPQLCKGFPNTMDIRANPLRATQRFNECVLTPEEAYDKLDQVGISKAVIQNVLKQVYSPPPLP